MDGARDRRLRLHILIRIRFRFRIRFRIRIGMARRCPLMVDVWMIEGVSAGRLALFEVSTTVDSLVSAACPGFTLAKDE